MSHEYKSIIVAPKVEKFSLLGMLAKGLATVVGGVVAAGAACLGYQAVKWAFQGARSAGRYTEDVIREKQEEKRAALASHPPEQQRTSIEVFPELKSNMAVTEMPPVTSMTVRNELVLEGLQTVYYPQPDPEVPRYLIEGGCLLTDAIIRKYALQAAADEMKGWVVDKKPVLEGLDQYNQYLQAVIYTPEVSEGLGIALGGEVAAFVYSRHSNRRAVERLIEILNGNYWYLTIVEAEEEMGYRHPDEPHITSEGIKFEGVKLGGQRITTIVRSNGSLLTDFGRFENAECYTEIVTADGVDAKARGDKLPHQHCAER
ncbi:hypothetical protein HYR99_19405 [Candidatus Poribacteria bacterium]|nr:hypothetical protein [Candidatus Poribacteria bacterium]